MSRTARSSSTSTALNGANGGGTESRGGIAGVNATIVTAIALVTRTKGQSQAVTVSNYDSATRAFQVYQLQATLLG